MSFLLQSPFCFVIVSMPPLIIKWFANSSLNFLLLLGSLWVWQRKLSCGGTHIEQVWIHGIYCGNDFVLLSASCSRQLYLHLIFLRYILDSPGYVCRHRHKHLLHTITCFSRGLCSHMDKHLLHSITCVSRGIQPPHNPNPKFIYRPL